MEVRLVPTPTRSNRNRDPVNVLFIGGSARSGSTLLDRLLGQVPRFFSAGELSFVWTRGFSSNGLCGCGVRFQDCDLWSQVVREAFGGFSEANARRVLSLKSSIERTHNLHRLLWPAVRSKGFSDQLEQYTEALARLYAGIRDVTGASVVVDSSKLPMYAFALRAVPSLRLHVVHIVRDSRAVAFSHMRRRLRTPDAEPRQYMPTASPSRSALRWNVDNALLEILRRTHRDCLSVFYEDLANDPKGTMRRILSSLGEDGDELGFLRSGRAQFGVNHTVSGNPMRFATGEVEIRPDSEWQRRMARSTKLLVTTLTLPLLFHYRYMAPQGHA